MKALPPLLLLIFASLALGPVAVAEEQEDHRTSLVMLLTELAETAGMGSACEEVLHELGKDALTTEPCRRFTERYRSLWGDRETLQRSILTFARRAETGQMPCDRQCHDMLRRCEELRVGITYVLDYVDFFREM